MEPNEDTMLVHDARPANISAKNSTTATSATIHARLFFGGCAACGGWGWP